jgi:F0F1-type ATP synthase gamma subunit
MLTPQIYKKKIGSMKIIQKISSIMKSSAYIKINKLSKIINDSKQNCSNIYQLVAKLLNYSEVRNRFFTQGLSTKTL